MYSELRTALRILVGPVTATTNACALTYLIKRLTPQGFVLSITTQGPLLPARYFILMYS